MSEPDDLTEDRLIAQVNDCVANSDTISAALPKVERRVRNYLQDEQARPINDGVLSDDRQVRFALEQDLSSYRSSFRRGHSHDTGRIRATARKIDRVKDDSSRGYDMFDTSTDADQCSVIDASYLRDAIDDYISYYHFIHSFDK